MEITVGLDLTFQSVGFVLFCFNKITEKKHYLYAAEDIYTDEWTI